MVEYEYDYTTEVACSDAIEFECAGTRTGTGVRFVMTVGVVVAAGGRNVDGPPAVLEVNLEVGVGWILAGV